MNKSTSFQPVGSIVSFQPVGSIVFTTYHSFYVYSGDLCHLSSILTSITFLQYDFLNVLPIGIILYIPILYLFFIKHERRKLRNEKE